MKKEKSPVYLRSIQDCTIFHWGVLIEANKNENIFVELPDRYVSFNVYVDFATEEEIDAEEEHMREVRERRTQRKLHKARLRMQL